MKDRVAFLVELFSRLVELLSIGSGLGVPESWYFIVLWERGARWRLVLLERGQRGNGRVSTERRQGGTDQILNMLHLLDSHKC